MRKLFVVIIQLCSLHFYLHAQEIKMDTYTPPTPEVAALLKFTETPVSYNTGVPNINVDLYNLKIDENLTIPFNLQYNSGGVKVDQVATSFGLGWSLNGSGVITKVLKGDNDDYTQGDYRNTEIAKYKVEITDPRHNYINLKESGGASNDLQPDVYYLSLFNMNIKFTYDFKLQQFVQYPLSATKIIPLGFSGYDIASWKVIDDKGYEYYFGFVDNRMAVEYESSVTYPFGPTAASQSPRYIRNWHLLKIVTPKKQIVTFEYDQEDTYEDLSLSSQFKYYAYPQTALSGSLGTPPLMSQSLGRMHNQVQTIFSIQGFNTTHLKRVNYGNTTIELVKSLVNREDLLGNAKSISYFVVKAGDRVVVKRKMNYSYFTDNEANVINPYLSSALSKFKTSIGKRLRLDSVELLEATDKLEGKYLFKYYSNELPNRVSFSRDAWGYYNGASTNTELIPSIVFTKNTISNLMIGSANRRIDSHFSKYGTLTEMTYPTGGKVIFDYENNSFSVNHDINIPYDLSLGTGDSNPLSPVTIFFAADEVYDENTGNPYHLNTYSTRFTLTQKTLSKLKVDIQGCDQMSGTNCIYEVFLKKVNDVNFAPIQLNNSFNTTELELMPGEYELIANRINFEITIECGFQILLENYSITTPKKEFYTAGGLRIKKVNHYDQGNLSISKEYEYNFFDKPLTSGIAWSLPVFIEPGYDYGINNAGSNYICKFFGLANFPYSDIASNLISYDAVTEKHVDFTRNENFKTQYEYSSKLVNSFLPDSNFSLNVNIPDSSWRISNLLTRKDFKNEEGIDFLVKEEQNEYASFNQYFNQSFGVRVEPRETNGIVGTSESYNLYKTEFYSFYTENFRLTKKTIHDYFKSNNKITTVTTFNYSDFNNQIKEQTITGSNAYTVLSKISYAHEMANQSMIDANMISIPLKTETFKNGSLIGSQETIYQKNAATNNLILPMQVFSKKDNQQASELKATYNSYDDKGNLTQYTIESGMPVTILWGYNKTQPIAKLENAKYTDVQQYEANLQTLSNGSDENALLLALNTLRENFPNAMVTTYTYKPLIGVSTITNPKGEKVTYTYDEFNRLKQVIDHNGNILNENQYNYRPQ